AVGALESSTSGQAQASNELHEGVLPRGPRPRMIRAPTGHVRGEPTAVIPEALLTRGEADDWKLQVAEELARAALVRSGPWRESGAGIERANPLDKCKPRILLILPWLCLGGVDKFNLDLLAELSSRGWEATVAATLHAEHGWHREYTLLTPD